MSTTEQSFSTQDLRASSQDSKRESESKRKWEHGEVWPVGRQLNGPGRPARPARPRSSRNNPLPTHYNHVNEAKMLQRLDIMAEKAANSDNSCDEDYNEPMTASVPDAEITYSFDAERGPSNGSQILGLALAKAVERFESNVTDKLVKDEYEVLDSEGETLSTKVTGKKSPKIVPAVTTAATASNAARDEDDYEFV